MAFTSTLNQCIYNVTQNIRYIYGLHTVGWVSTGVRLEAQQQTSVCINLNANDVVQFGILYTGGTPAKTIGVSGAG